MERNSKLLTAQASRDIDKKAKEAYGIPNLILMENAANAVAEEAMKMRAKIKKIALFCGKGNNGGDGFAAARHLLASGIKPDIFLAGEARDVKKEARINLEILLRLRQKIIEAREDNLCFIKNKISGYGLIIDALLGVGLEGEVRGVVRDLIGIVNSSRARVLSVDIPSGLDADSGRVLGCCVKADRTVTFVARKRGMLIADGPKYCGRIVVKNIGLIV